MLAGGLDPQQVSRIVERGSFELVHAHNINPLFGVRALEAARAAGARIVLHLHNYRLFCAIGIGFREGLPCTRCRGRNTWPGVRLRCRGDIAQAAAYGAGLALQQRALIGVVDRFIAPSNFTARRLEALGLPGFRTDVLPNFVGPSHFAPAATGGGEYALFAGRLVEEKGIDTAIEASAWANVPLVIAGAGPDEHRLRDLAFTLAAPVTFLGRLDSAGMKATLAAAAFLLAPSRWDEPCPYSVIEAMAAGLPVLASDRGGLPEMVGARAALPAGQPGRWASEMAALWWDGELRRERAAGSLERARRLFSPERFYSGLMSVYDQAAARR